MLSQSLQPRYLKFTSKPISDNSFLRTNAQFQVAYHIIPHIQYMGKKRFGIDVNFPLYIFAIGSLASTINNPALSKAQQSYTVFNFYTFNGSQLLAMLIGLVYKL